jgi:hypothetical protein
VFDEVIGYLSHWPRGREIYGPVDRPSPQCSLFVLHKSRANRRPTS